MSTYRLRLRVTGTGTRTVGSSLDRVVVGVDIPRLDIGFDQGAGEDWQQVLVPLSIVSGAPRDIDLRSSTNTVLDASGRPLNLATLWFAALAVTSAGALQIGPLSQTGAAQLWFGATSGSEVVDDQVIRTSAAGWTLTATTASKIRVQNPGTGTVTGALWLAGKR